MEIKHYATFYYPGIFIAEDETIEVKTKDIKELTLPSKQIFAVKFFDRTFTEDVYKGEKITLSSKPINEELYQIGKFLNLEEVKDKYGEKSPAYGNCINNGYIGLCDSGSWCSAIRTEEEKNAILDPSTLKYKEDEGEQ